MVNRNGNECSIGTKIRMTTCLQRKFPGPAGILSKIEGLNINRDRLSERNEKDTNEYDQNGYMQSQSSALAFDQAPWTTMCKDFEDDSCGNVALPVKYNIDWIKRKLEGDKLINQRAPFLAAVVKHIEGCNNRGSSLILEDRTGKIRAYVPQELYEKFASYLTDGTVVVLKQLTVLLMHNKSEPYVLITEKTLIAMYAKKPKQSQWEVRKVQVQEITGSEILREIASVQSRAVTKQNDSSIRNSVVCDTSSTLNELLADWVNEDVSIFDSYVNSYERDKELFVKSVVSSNQNVLNYRDVCDKKLVLEKDNKLNNVRSESRISMKVDCGFNKTTTNGFPVNKPIEGTSKKFNFKSVKSKLNDSFAVNSLLHPSTSDSIPMSTIPKPKLSLFDESIQLDLNLDDFVDDFKVPECNSNTEVMHSHHFTRECENTTGKEIDSLTNVCDLTDSVLKLDSVNEVNSTEKISHMNDVMSRIREDEQPPLKKFKMSTDKIELLSSEELAPKQQSKDDTTPVKTSRLGFFDVDVNIDFNISQIHTSTVVKSKFMDSIFSDVDTDSFFGDF